MKRWIALALALLLGSSCGTMRYNRAWEQFHGPAQPNALEGRWRGQWRSDYNGHSGALRCIMTKRDETSYEAWFHSTYAHVLTFQYKSDFSVHVEQDAYSFVGDKDLGELAGGIYHYEGWVRGDVFQATFEAANGDYGTFDMRRVN